MQASAPQIGGDGVTGRRERLLHRVLEVSTQAIVCVDAEGRISLANSAAERIFGYRVAELMGQPVQLLLPERHREAHAQHMKAFWGEPRNRPMGRGLALTGRRKDGSEFPAEITLNFIADDAEPTVTVFITDTTQDQLYEKLRQSEALLRASEERYREITEQITDGVFVADASGHYLDGNRAGCQMLGYTHEELKRKSFKDLLAPEEHSRLTEQLQRLRAGEVIRDEWRFERKDGSWLIGELQGRQLPDGRFIGSLRDVTDRKALEEKLRESESKFRALVRASSQVLYRMSPDWSEMRDLGGSGFIANTHAPTRNWLKKYIPPAEQGLLQETIERAIRERTVFELEHRIILRDGSIGWVHSRAVPLLDAKGEVTEWFGSADDVTARKRSEEKLRDSEERLRVALESANLGFWEWDLIGNKVRRSPEWKRQLGYGEHEIGDAFDEWASRVHPDDLKPSLEAAKLAFQNTDQKYAKEFRVRHKDGTYRHMYAIGTVHRDATGKGVRMLGCDVDITDFKRQEEALRQSEDRLRSFMEYAPVGIAICDRDMRYVSVNSRWTADAGLSGNPSGQSHYEVLPEVPERWKDVYRRVLAGETFSCEEDRLVRSNGVVQWVRWAALPWRDASGQIAGIFLLHVDITKSKEVEQQLATSEERLRLAAEVARFGAFDYDPLMRRASYWSPTLYELAGLPPGSEITEKLLTELVHEEDRERFARAFHDSMDPRRPESLLTIEYRIVQPSGAIRWWRSTSRTYFTGEREQRSAVRMIGAAVDITERILLRKQLEAALHWSDEERKAIVAAAPIAVATFDSKGTVTSWNPAAEQIFGYRADEVIGRLDPTLPIAEQAVFQDAIQKALHGERIRQTVQRVKGDKSKIDVMLSIAPLHGERDGVVALSEDITAQTKAEAELARVRGALQNAREEEARRIARELHDDVTQRLSLLAIDLGRTATEQSNALDLAPVLRSYQSRVMDIGEAVRQVSHRLHPSVLDDLGLESALEYVCADYAQSEGVPVSFRTENVPRNLPGTVAICLYRIVQEALHNISKYARASHVDVSLTQKGVSLELCVIDSGDGFQVESTKSGLGLHSMKERLSLVNGRFSIDSVPGEGTRVVAVVPLPQAALIAKA